MKTIVAWVVFVLSLYAVQSSVVPLVGIAGISTDFMLLLTVSYAILRGARHGVYMGFAVGLLQDLATGTFFGVQILAKMLIGYGVGFFARRLYKEQFMLPLVACIAATGATYLVSMVFSYLLGYPAGFFRHTQDILLPMVLYNAAFALPVHWLVSCMDTWGKDANG